jgi:hypothetical protein
MTIISESTIIKFFITFLAGHVSGFLHKWWISKEPTAMSDAVALGKKLETRMGWTAPVWVHDVGRVIVTDVIKALDILTSDSSILRNAFRWYETGNPANMADVLAKVDKIDLAGDIAAQLPEELKQAVNVVKADQAVKIVKSVMVQKLPAEYVPDDATIRNVVNKSVNSVKVDAQPNPMRPEELQKLVEDMRIRNNILLPAKK